VNVRECADHPIDLACARLLELAWRIASAIKITVTDDATTRAEEDGGRPHSCLIFLRATKSDFCVPSLDGVILGPRFSGAASELVVHVSQSLWVAFIWCRQA
jgi:hypothetical protein